LARLADDYICGSDGNISVVLGLDIEYGVGSKRASISTWRPRLAPDPKNKEGVVLEMGGVREADVLSAFHSYRYIDADQFCLWQPFRADDGITVQGHEYRSSSVTLRQGPASPI